MKIIDAHLHLFPQDARTAAMAEKVGHENSLEHLRRVYGELDMVHGVVMGNRSLNVDYHDYPADLFHYCVGLDSSLLEGGERRVEDLPDILEEHLKGESLTPQQLSRFRCSSRQSARSAPTPSPSRNRELSSPTQ